MSIPDFIVHYSRGEPFLSLSALPQEELSGVLQHLDETNAWGLARFSDPEYLARRRLVEQRVRDEFIAKGGKPQLNHPIYFFLGRNDHFEKHPDNRSHPVRLRDLPPDSVSFTYGDSMFSLNEDYRKLKADGYLSDLCPHVYTLEELPGLFSHADFQRPNRLPVEAQLWINPGLK